MIRNEEDEELVMLRTMRDQLLAFDPDEPPCGVVHKLGGDCANTNTHFWCLHGPLVMILNRIGISMIKHSQPEQFEKDLSLLSRASEETTSADTRAHCAHTGRQLVPFVVPDLEKLNQIVEQTGDRATAALEYSKVQQVQTLHPLVEMRSRYLSLLESRIGEYALG